MMERFVLEFALKVVIIAASTGALLSIMRVKSAAIRHAAWTSVLFIMLLLPLWTALGPRTILHVPLRVPAYFAVHQNPLPAGPAIPQSPANGLAPTAVIERWNWTVVLV